jgi:nucleotide-binding universal stress UspA family protein
VADAGRIVVGVDGSAGSDVALAWAAREALLRRLPVRVVHATIPGHLPAMRSTAAQATAEWMDQGNEIAARAVRQVRSHGVAHVEAEVYFNETPVRALADEARSATLLVVGARGGSFKDLLLGSTAARVLEQVSVPIVVVREAANGSGTAPTPGEVVVGLDGSPPSLRALRFACEEAALRSTGITVVHAQTTPQQSTLAPETADLASWSFLGSSAVAALDKCTAIQLTGRVVRGQPEDVLVDISQDAELLVLGSRGRGGLAGRILGSVSQRVVDHTGCPVAVLR